MKDEEFVTITQKQFEIWKLKCTERAEEMRRKIFEVSSDEDEELVEEMEEASRGTVDVVRNEQKKVKENIFRRIIKYRFPTTIDPYGDNVFLFYQFLVAVCFTYNACSIPVRMSFPYQTKENLTGWLIVDYIADAINFFDIIVFQIRCQYIEGGNFMRERKDTMKHYLKSKDFRLDLISILPTDFMYFLVGFKPVLRLNRLFKYKSFDGFNSKFEMVLEQAYVFRVARTTCYLLYFIHIDACLYYFVSYYQGFQTPWGYQQVEGNIYIRCFYWGFLTTVTIGNVGDPTTNFEFAFQCTNFFLGLFIFSIVIGQVRDCVQAHSAEQADYRRKKNNCIYYMELNNIPPSVQKKVRQWFEYTWETQKILDEEHLLSQIPVKMHADIAINVHIAVLNKVQLFKGCDQQLLNDLVLKLRPVLYLPGDYICKKGEIGKEMYIISNGCVQVVGETKAQVFATLSAGTAFGEISLLAIGGANRRTANIFSPGFATLFILKKNDLHDVVKNYPRTQMMLKRKAKEILKQDRDKPPPKKLSASELLPEGSGNKAPKRSSGRGYRFLRHVVDAADNKVKGLRQSKNS
ncbi:cyclic nucleotide-gated channel beta-1-like [Styela clava]|uniref:cyclic nucleotide-gated cation channel beta-1-like n=1 Tax=Styela clava TaxID=7725 RepID=UPI001939D0BC|nr:cyclic nucleotide-gated cation channel beta-1-like [Styela clava]